VAAPVPAQPQNQGFVVVPQKSTRPDGSVVHVVQSGDTLFGMALAYGVTVDDIMRLNNIQSGQLLQLGQELIIKSPTGPAAPAPAPQPPAAPQPAQPQPTAVAAAQAAPAVPSTPGGLCVQAFNDRNGNGLYDTNEDLIANVKFNVLAGSDPVATYTTNGTSEPHCFTGLSARAYTVRVEPPKNVTPTTDEQVGVALAAGQTANVSFGVQTPGGKVAAKSASTATADSGNVLTRFGGVVLGICGLGVLIVAGVVGYAFVSRRR
jgi:LysM repeat protein